MESSESPNSKDSTTFTHDAVTSEIKDQVESSPTTSSHGQTSSTGNYQVMADQPRHGNVDEQQPLIENVNEQQPGSDVVRNPCLNQQARPNHIANMIDPRRLMPHHLNPWLPPNERHQPPRVRPHYPPLRGNAMDGDQIEYRIPHFHLTIGNRDWTFNDFKQRIPVRVSQRPPMNERQQSPPRELELLPLRPRRRVQINECHEQLMNIGRPITICEPLPNSLPSTAMQRHPPLVSRREIEPGIFQEIYSRYPVRRLRRMFGSNRCMCENYVNCNLGNKQMISVIIHTPNLNKRFSMTISRKSPIQMLFDAYFIFTKETTKTVFVAAGKRLRGEDTPRRIGMKNRENIYTFISFEEYNKKPHKTISMPDT